MKTHRIVPKAIAAGILTSFAGLAAAAGSTTVTVSATVTAACKFTAATMAAIALGSIDPSSVAAAVTGTSDITYQCTKGTTPVVSITGGGSRTLALAGHTDIPYTFSLGTADAGTGFSAVGSAKVTATATIALTDAQDAEAGVNYQDVVTLTINN